MRQIPEKNFLNLTKLKTFLELQWRKVFHIKNIFYSSVEKAQLANSNENVSKIINVI
jgi:hypothetical protein